MDQKSLILPRELREVLGAQGNLSLTPVLVGKGGLLVLLQWFYTETGAFETLGFGASLLRVYPCSVLVVSRGSPLLKLRGWVVLS